MLELDFWLVIDGFNSLQGTLSGKGKKLASFSK
jgi:hypothetical protein